MLLCKQILRTSAQEIAAIIADGNSQEFDQFMVYLIGFLEKSTAPEKIPNDLRVRYSDSFDVSRSQI